MTIHKVDNSKDMEIINTYFLDINKNILSKVSKEEIINIKTVEIFLANRKDKEHFHIQQLIFNVVFLVFVVFLAIYSFK